MSQSVIPISRVEARFRLAEKNAVLNYRDKLRLELDKKTTTELRELFSLPSDSQHQVETNNMIEKLLFIRGWVYNGRTKKWERKRCAK